MPPEVPEPREKAHMMLLTMRMPARKLPGTIARDQ